MVLIIDAYNVLHMVKESKEFEGKTFERARDHFIVLLNRYVRLKRELKKAIVVFDGGSLRYAVTEKFGTLDLINSGYVDSADEVIIGLARRHLQNAVIVTSDVGLTNQVKNNVGGILKSHEFWHKVRQALASEQALSECSVTKSQLVEFEHLEDEENISDEQKNILRELMEASTQGIIPTKDDADGKDCSPGSLNKQMSRFEKKQTRLMKKL